MPVTIGGLFQPEAPSSSSSTPREIRYVHQRLEFADEMCKDQSQMVGFKPGMGFADFARALAKDLRIKTGTEVVKLETHADG